MKTGFLAGPLVAALLTVSLASAQTPKKKSEMTEDMRKAIAFERYKDQAAARQARIEARQSGANRSVSEEKTAKPKK